MIDPVAPVTLAAAADRIRVGLADHFVAARRLYPWPAGREVRELAACGTAYSCFYLPWRGLRRGARGAPPPIAQDTGERIIERETLWRGRGLALTPNRYPFAPDHLLLWEEAPVREPGPALLEVLLRLCAFRPDLLGLVNTIGSAATVTRAHAQITGVPEARALEGVAVEWEGAAGLELGFPVADGPWPVFFVALRGEPGRVAEALTRLLRLRRTAAFNLVVQGERVCFFPRTHETCAGAYSLPLGALELAGVFGFEDRPAYEALTGELAARALAGTCLAPAATAADAVRRVLTD